jgi:hypothetical protein
LIYSALINSTGILKLESTQYPLYLELVVTIVGRKQEMNVYWQLLRRFDIKPQFDIWEHQGHIRKRSGFPPAFHFSIRSDTKVICDAQCLYGWRGVVNAVNVR